MDIKIATLVNIPGAETLIPRELKDLWNSWELTIFKDDSVAGKIADWLVENGEWELETAFRAFIKFDAANKNIVRSDFGNLWRIRFPLGVGTSHAEEKCIEGLANCHRLSVMSKLAEYIIAVIDQFKYCGV